MVPNCDLKIERFNDGKGGQNQNKSPKNVRITHIPTGVMATVRGRYYHKNVALAKKEIENRIESQKEGKIAAAKKARRDDRIKNARVIRTYDYTTGMVKDHRTGRKMTIKQAMIKGNIDELLLR